MHSNNGSDWISQLSNELLLQIFEYDLTTATLVRCMLCCKRWKELVISVLYKHVTLISTEKLSRWIAATPPSLDSTIKSLTLRLDLDKLAVRLQRMVTLRSVSISTSTPENLAYGLWIPDLSVAKILQNIPKTCSNLELAALRLALPCICSESFGSFLSQSSTSTPEFGLMQAPKLQNCIIRLASACGGGDVERFDGTCNHDVSLSGVKAFVECLLFLTASGQAPLLQKLWVCDALPRGNDSRVSYEAFVRRDILAKKSHTFPWNVIASSHKAKNGLFIRMPAEEGGQDLVEGHAWITATNGARLPATVMAKYRLPRQHCITQTRAEWSASSKISTMLWVNERVTGMRLLDAETGGLLENRPANFRKPEGWRRDPSGLGLERVS
ncbi:hypothetical protein GGR58DRAFT_499064 [Xylaria digitata]|nr:hypothetical protein GGR58DRAFT_499064 [Xylaria digitata]